MFAHVAEADEAYVDRDKKAARQAVEDGPWPRMIGYVRYFFRRIVEHLNFGSRHRPLLYLSREATSIAFTGKGPTAVQV